MVQGRDTTVTKIERWLKRAEAFGKETAYTLFVHPAVFEFLIENNEERLTMLRSSTRLAIDLVVDAKIAIEEFHCFSAARAIDVTEEFMSSTRRQAKPEPKLADVPTHAPEPLKSFSRPQDSDLFGRKPKAKKRR
jgi:ribonuclease G